VTFNNEELDDLVIERSDGYPTYNFAVVVDDAEMGITHVIRGDDHLNNTPRQILLYEALGHPIPHFGHVPMILGADKTRLSKRHGATSVMAYKDMGYLPEALVNYLVRLGWSHGDQEIFSPEELVQFFDLGQVGKAAAVFNPEKLLWLNQHYIKASPIERLATEIEPFLAQPGIVLPERSFTAQVVKDLHARAKTLVEMAQAAAFYFQEQVTFDEAAIKALPADAVSHLEAIAAGLPALPEYNKESIETLLRDLAVSMDTKLKFIAQSLRVALTGKTVSPGLDEIMITLGKDKVAERIRRAVEYLVT
jgi:glutamyl-tRNA synthetase